MTEPDCRYYPGPVTVQAHNSDARVKMMWGPLGTAKTTWLCWRVYLKAKEAAEEGKSLRAIIIRDTYRNLEDSTLKTWLHWFPDGRAGQLVRTKPADFILHVGERTHEVLFRHGQTAQDASDFLGTEYGLIGLEEIAPAYLPGKNQLVSPGIAEEVFDMALSRGARALTDVKAEFALTCNPPSPSHWASKRIIDKSGNDKHGRIEFDSGAWEHWFTPISENMANLQSTYYQTLIEGWPRILVRRFVEGERVDIFVGIPRFNLDALDEMKKRAQEPSFRGFLQYFPDNILKIRPEANPNGYVRIWREPRPTGQYVLFFDVAEGLEGLDYSSGHVLDRADLGIAATWHGHIEPEKLGAEEIPKIGKMYNDALAGVESNNHGLTTLVALKNSGYPRIFWQQKVDVRNRKSERIGWRTDTATKPLMINDLANWLAEGGQVIDAETIQELMTYGVAEDGTTKAQAGCFDDRVVSLAGAIQMNKFSGLERIFPALGRRSA